MLNTSTIRLSKHRRIKNKKSENKCIISLTSLLACEIIHVETIKKDKKPTMTNPLEELIAATINRLAFERVTVESNPVEFAKQLANSLTFASWEQLAQVTGASTQFDNDGQLVLYTGCYQKAAEPNIIHARDLTPEEAEADGWAEPF
jgi:hypothetical protein